jgi:uncharacterized protein
MQYFKNKLFYECVVIFGIFPFVVALLKPRGWMYGLLWFATFVAMAWLNNRHYKLPAIWNGQALTKNLIYSILGRFIPLSLALLLFTWLVIPDRLFSLPLERPEIWVMVMVFYPILSVFPQEIIFRSFFFRRYSPIFSTPKLMIITSALAFGWVHVLLLNWVAIVFSFFGGLIFASSYNKTRSLAVVCFEHAIYGCMVFTLGLGYYFYHGHAVN